MLSMTLVDLTISSSIWALGRSIERCDNHGSHSSELGGFDHAESCILLAVDANHSGRNSDKKQVLHRADAQGLSVSMR